MVQIYSPQARDDSSNLLNKLIKDFSVVAADTREADLELACSLSRELKATAFCGGSVAAGQWGPLKITVQIRNAKVYEILDEIIAQNGKAIWTVTVPPEKLSQIRIGALWHVDPLQPPFKTPVLEKLTSIAAAPR